LHGKKNAKNEKSQKKIFKKQYSNTFLIRILIRKRNQPKRKILEKDFLKTIFQDFFNYKFNLKKRKQPKTRILEKTGNNNFPIRLISACVAKAVPHNCTLFNKHSLQVIGFCVAKAAPDTCAPFSTSLLTACMFCHWSFSILCRLCTFMRAMYPDLPSV